MSVIPTETLYSGAELDSSHRKMTKDVLDNLFVLNE